MAKASLPQIPLNRLQPGLTVKLPLSWKDHPFWINRITISDAVQIEMIRGLGCQFVYLISGEPLAEDAIPEMAEIHDVLPIEEIKDLQFQTRKALRQSQQRFLQSVNETRNTYSKLVSDPEGAIALSEKLAHEMVSHLLEHPSAQLALVDLGDSQISVTQHSSSVAVLSLMIGKALGLDDDELRCLALGSLFHDIGKLKIPESIRNKVVDLNEHERNFINMHPNFGYDMVTKGNRFDPRVCHIVLHHHEFLDGSGYPDGLQGDNIPLLTQIVALADDYDHQLAREGICSPQVALGYLFKNRVGKHADNLIQTLVKVLGIYPPGTLVRLSDETIGKVMITSSELSSPQVWGCEIDGSEPGLKFLASANLKIEEVIKVESLTEPALKVLKADAAISYYFTASVN
ncbi:HD-GYP domain-containing protein [Shewanella sp. NIFS-20-20]|uniref:HD-GYP domain-containing protein n=1 Tax=Shewanella sp. NIFS-20-20 TaxID=2853806 RepID=UPI001C436DBE|nr:HD domain-containing phosphohydrolase [Shewanella sp. NIFS-20-20]MBV7315538.1 HD domain-containing protein [Shewanella sp. NIFS-20-20]